MRKAIYFDMDGTIANLYGVENWLPLLRSCDASPYVNALPMLDMAKLWSLLNGLKAKGYHLGVISWLSKESTPEYKKEVRKAKQAWLNHYLPTLFDEIHLVQYGTPKHLVARHKNGIIFDDDEKIRAAWKGLAVHPNEIMQTLQAL